MPRIKGIMKIKELALQMDAMETILKQLKSDKEQAAEQKSVIALRQQMNETISKIKVNFRIQFTNFRILSYHDHLILIECQKNKRKRNNEIL